MDEQITGLTRADLIVRMVALVGEERVVSERAQLRTYECDGLTSYRVIPSLVVLPETVSQLEAVVRLGLLEPVRAPFTFSSPSGMLFRRTQLN